MKTRSGIASVICAPGELDEIPANHAPDFAPVVNPILVSGIGGGIALRLSPTAVGSGGVVVCVFLRFMAIYRGWRLPVASQKMVAEVNLRCRKRATPIIAVVSATAWHLRESGGATLNPWV